MTRSPRRSQRGFPENLREIIQLTVLVLGSGVFLAAGVHSLLTASQTTLHCKTAQRACRVTRSTLISRHNVDFSIAQLNGAYLNQTGTVMLSIDPEYPLSEGIYAASTPYGQDILQQAIANEINAFVESPRTDLRLTVSNRLFKSVVGLTLIVTVGIFPAFMLSARQTGRRRTSFRLPMMMISLSLFFAGVLLVVAINHQVELNCANRQCVLSAWRLQERGSITLSAASLHSASIRQTRHTSEEGDSRIVHQVVLVTDQGDFSLLANAQAMPAIALAEQINRYINDPAINQVNFQTDNWLLVTLLGGVCGLLGGGTLLFAWRS